MPNIAIFGGTFNPVHWGHLLIAETAIDQFQLDRVIWVPAFHSPHKTQPLLTFEHRLEMVRRAIADQPAFTVSAVEGQRQGFSYAIATLNALQGLEPNAHWYWILGDDAFQSLPNWYASEALIEQCIWLVAPRIVPSKVVGKQDAQAQGVAGDKDVKAPLTDRPLSLPHSFSPSPHREAEASYTPDLSPQLHWHQLQTPLIDISSTLIRQRCQESRSIRYLVPETVRCYIAGQNLYRMS